MLIILIADVHTLSFVSILITISPRELVHPLAGGLESVPPTMKDPDVLAPPFAIPQRLPPTSKSGKPAGFECEGRLGSES